ncbi:SDR family oxidoreductase [Levilactobacillus cerevisiae]|uniref:SDR family oxidoreductase n=1 Tax=Levilactobacillus cerevisiae TaxID=1704076 RepID=UPI000F7AD003|nr:SDR family oxidoreductase [Levilactobacillus cerevisiae]
MKKVVLITGASSGMGAAAVKLFADKGWIVYGGARRQEKIPTGPNIHAIRVDITSSVDNQAFVDQALQENHRIDVLINAAGYGEYGAVEEVAIESVKKEFATNLFGVMQLTQLVLPTMRAQKKGRIVNISSGMGSSYMPTGGYYGASKAALQYWSDTLNAEITPFGLRSVVVQPGATQSAFIDHMVASFDRNTHAGSPYARQLAGVITMSKNYQAIATVEDLARVFYRAATEKRPKRRYFNSLSDRLSANFAQRFPGLWRVVIDRMTRGWQKATD